MYFGGYASGVVQPASPRPAEPGQPAELVRSPEPSFAAVASAISDAFGDPTRRRVYRFVREAGRSGVSATMVAGAVGVHPNVARRHLDKLAAGGYLARAAEDAPRRGAGRPSKRYVAVDEPSGPVPVRTDELILALLGRAIALLPVPVAEAMAEEVGADYGRSLAAGLGGDAVTDGQRSLRSAMRAVVDALTAHGFAAHTDRAGSRLRIVQDHCPFGAVAIDHPVICAVDRGMVRGMLGALSGARAATAVATEASIALGDEICATTLGDEASRPATAIR